MSGKMGNSWKVPELSGGLWNVAPVAERIVRNIMSLETLQALIDMCQAARSVYPNLGETISRLKVRYARVLPTANRLARRHTGSAQCHYCNDFTGNHKHYSGHLQSLSISRGG